MRENKKAFHPRNTLFLFNSRLIIAHFRTKVNCFNCFLTQIKKSLANNDNTSTVLLDGQPSELESFPSLVSHSHH